MRWVRLVVSVVGQLVSWGGFLAYLLDIPSPMQGKSAHGLVAFMTSTPVVLAPCVVGIIVTGPLLWTSGWWWPRTSQWVRRIRRKDETRELVAEDTVSKAVDAHIAKFKELEPLIARHRKARQPISDPYLLTLTWNSTDQFALGADQENLIANLDALRIPHPLSDADRSVWFNYLVRLEATCQTGDLEEARSLYRSNGEVGC